MKKILAILGTLGVAASLLTFSPASQKQLKIEQEKHGVVSLFLFTR